MNHKLMIFSFAILTLLPSIVLADSGAVLLLVFLFPIFAVTYGYFTNLFVAYLNLRFVIRKRINDKHHFFTFILKYTPLIVIFEIVLLFITFQIDNYLLSAAIYSILSGVTIFLVFDHFISKELKIRKHQIKSPLFMRIITSPLTILLVLYILPFILKVP